MAVELKNRVDRDLGLSVPLVHYLDGSGLGRLAEVLLDNVDAVRRTGGTPDTLDTAAAAELLTRLDALADDDVDRLLRELSRDETSE